MTARRPLHAVLREGNPGHRSRAELESVRLPPAELVEPRWLDTFPAVPGAHAGRRAENARCRLVAAREWARVVPVLERAVGVADVDLVAVQDYCVCVARVDQLERQLSLQGMVVQGRRGPQKNGAATIVGQYREQLRVLVRELGLTPAARRRLPGRADDGTAAFDV